MRAPQAISVAWLFAGVAAAGPSKGAMRGSLLPKIDSSTWEGWEPSSGFAREFGAWPDRKVPDEIEVWCKGFIPQNATQQVIDGKAYVPILGPGNVPIPGLLGMCAGVDGRGWSSTPPDSDRPTDARFWAWLRVSGGRGRGVAAHANCGMSENVCCQRDGCWGGAKYGDVTCSEHCPDSQMQMQRLACWTPGGTSNGTAWERQGEACQGGAIVAAKVYIQGRGGNPCGRVLSINAPPASWDVGVAVFPTKRKVTITGYVDDAPSYECYARAKDNDAWGPPVTLAQVPMDLSENIGVALAGYSDRPVNADGRVFDLPEPSTSEGAAILV